jgi:hypothetical protein
MRGELPLTTVSRGYLRSWSRAWARSSQRRVHHGIRAILPTALRADQGEIIVQPFSVARGIGIFEQRPGGAFRSNVRGLGHCSVYDHSNF